MLSRKLIAVIFTLFASVCMISTTQAIADEDLGKSILEESAGTDWLSKDGEFSGAQGFAEKVAPEGSEVNYEEQRSNGEPVGFKKYSESSSSDTNEEWTGDSTTTTSETTSEEGSKGMPVKTMKEKPEMEKPEGMSQKPGKESPKRTMKEKPGMEKPKSEMPPKPDKEMPDKPVKGDQGPSDKPEPDKVASEKPTVEKPGVDKPEKKEISYEKPSKEKPSYETPSKEKPSIEKPTKDDLAKGDDWGTDGQEPTSKWDTDGKEPSTQWDTEGKEPSTGWETDGEVAEWGQESPSHGGESYAGGGTKPSVGHGEILKGDDFATGFDHSSSTSSAAFNNIDFGSHVGSGSHSNLGTGGFNHSTSGAAQPKVEMPNNIFSN